VQALIFDTETTDLISNSLLPDQHQPRVIEFYGHIVEDDGTVLQGLEFLCNPGIKINEKITSITGISQSDIENAPPFLYFEGQLRGLIEAANAVVAHNLSYDFDVINFEFKRLYKLDYVQWPMTRICTVQETEWYKGYRLSLTALHEHLFDKGFPSAHRAKDDVMALTRCYLELLKRGDL